MPLWTDVITPAELTGYVRADLNNYERNRVTLAQFLPNETIADITARVYSGDNGLVEVAQYRGYDAETPIGSRGAQGRSTVELPPLGKKVRVSEYDQLRSQNADTDEAVRNQVLREAVRQSRAVADRMEHARGQVLVNAGLTLNENGLITTVNYGRSGSHAVAPSVLWSAANATPIADLDGWAETFRADTGENPGAVVMSRRIFNTIRVKLSGPGNPVNYVDNARVQQVFDDTGLGQVLVYDRGVRLNGANTRVVADNKVLLLPASVDPNAAEASNLGGTIWGRTLESQEPEYRIALEDQPGIVAGTHREFDPIGVWVKAAAIGMPVLANPDLSMVATVL